MQSQYNRKDIINSLTILINELHKYYKGNKYFHDLNQIKCTLGFNLNSSTCDPHIQLYHKLAYTHIYINYKQDTLILTLNTHTITRPVQTKFDKS